jgi:predicted nicotinamide N-methyase
MDSIEQEQPSPTQYYMPLVYDDKGWREVNIHADDDDDDDDDNQQQDDQGGDEHDDADDAVISRNIFDTMTTTENGDDQTYEDVEYNFPFITPDCTEEESARSATTNRIPQLIIRHQGEYPYSTGLAVWGGSELLAKYLILNSSKLLLRGTSSVMELGAGTGLCGIVTYYLLLLNNEQSTDGKGSSTATPALSSSSLWITDGDVDVLKNLRYNVGRNIRQTTSSSSSSVHVSCPQLIWGKDMDATVDKYGKQCLIIASDCTYMVASLRPMWETVDSLLEANGVFIWVNLCASTVPLELVLETAAAHNFEWEQPRYNVQNDIRPIDGFVTSKELKLFNDEIYLFRRRQSQEAEEE